MNQSIVLTNGQDSAAPYRKWRTSAIPDRLRAIRNDQGSLVSVPLFFFLQKLNRKEELPAGWQISEEAREASVRGFLKEDKEKGLVLTEEASRGLSDWSDVEVEDLRRRYEEQQAKQKRNGPFAGV